MSTFVENLDRFIGMTQRGEDRILMPRQIETIQKIRDFLNAGYTDGKVIKPTGIGKTVIFSKFIEAVLNGNDKKVLIVGPTRIILRQNQGKLNAFASIDAGAYFSYSKDLSRQVTITTYNSLRNLIKTGKINPKDYSILILDEAHRALGPQTVTAVESFDQSIKIGFTATPEFHEEKSVADILPFTIDEMSVREGIEENLLAGVKVFVMTTGLSTEKVERKGNEFDEKSLTKVINTSERNQFIVDLYHRELFFEKRAVVYAASRDHGKALTSAFQSKNISTSYLDGETKEFEREDILAKFKSGEIKVLCNVGVLVEGFDESEAEVCLNAAPTLSKVVAEQRGGRVLRRSKVKNNKIGYIVEVLDEYGKSINTPVLFSEILGASEILSPDNKKEESKIKKPQVRKTRIEKCDKTSTPGELVEDPKVIMDLTNKNRRQRFTQMFQYAPRGWVYSRRLAHELHVKESEIRGVAEKHCTDKPEWFRRYLTPTEILVTHYHPYLLDLVRRTFLSSLAGMVTPEQFGEIAVIEDRKAEELLETVDQITTTKAIRFSDISYFPLSDHFRIVRDELIRSRHEEILLDREAESLFWADDDLSDEQKEHYYWESFDEITSESKGVEVSEFEPDPLLHGDDIEQFDEDVNIPLIQDESFIQPLSGHMRKKIHNWLNFLPTCYTSIIKKIYFEDETYRAIARDLDLCTQTVINAERKSLELFRTRRYLIYLLEYNGISDTDLYRLSQPTDYESRNTPSAVIEFLNKLEIQHRACFLRQLANLN